MWKKSHHLIYSLLFVFSVAFISFFGLSSDSFAVSDFSGSFDNNSTYPFYICDESSSVLPHCSDYNYLILIPHISNSNYYQTVGFYYVNIRVPTFSQSILGLDPNMLSVNVSSFNFTGSFDFVLTESYSNCPICPDIPENPYDDKLDSIRNAIILVPAVCLLLYFFYVIFGILIPTTGGKK